MSQEHTPRRDDPRATIDKEVEQRALPMGPRVEIHEQEPISGSEKLCVVPLVTGEGEAELTKAGRDFRPMLDAAGLNFIQNELVDELSQFLHRTQDGGIFRRDHIEARLADC